MKEIKDKLQDYLMNSVYHDLYNMETNTQLLLDATFAGRFYLFEIRRRIGTKLEDDLSDRICETLHDHLLYH